MTQMERSLDMKVLFTPIGKTDPMSISERDTHLNIYDASMMHICRFYDFDKAIMYMSKEICEFDEKDNRYEIALNFLMKYKGKSCEIEKIRNKEDTNPHLFDKYYDEFESIIKAQIDEYGNDTEIYVNVSSGTPGMKMALTFISALSKYCITALQVSDPNRGRGQRKDDLEDYDVEGYWEDNEDNRLSTSERIAVLKTPNMQFRIQKESLLTMIDNYEYNAAYNFIKDASARLDPSLLELAEFAKERYALNKNKYLKIQKDNNWDFIPYKQDGRIELFEFALLMDIKSQKKELLDFCRCVTPFLYQSTMMILKDIFKIDLEQYTDYNGKLTRYLLHKDATGEKILSILDESYSSYYGNRVYEDSRLTQAQSINIIKGLNTNNGNLRRALNDLDEFRQKLRNQASHEIVCITQDYIEKTVKHPLSYYINCIKTILKSLNYDITNNWDSYLKMNQYIKDKIKEV